MTGAHTPSVGHTAGPWYEKQFGGRQIGGKGGYAICTMWGSKGNPEDDANTALITAAPDLLEALLIVQRNMQRGVTGAEARKGWDKARAAIAKATAARQSGEDA